LGLPRGLFSTSFHTKPLYMPLPAPVHQNAFKLPGFHVFQCNSRLQQIYVRWRLCNALELHSTTLCYCSSVNTRNHMWCNKYIRVNPQIRK
jgi:hypothetical protein